MLRHALSVVIALAVLAGAGCSLRQSAVAESDAKLLMRVLRENEQAYQTALQAERQAVAETRTRLESQSPAGAAISQLASVESRLSSLHARLEAVPVRSTTGTELLNPILDQLSREAADLAEIRESLAKPDHDREDLEGLKARLEDHSHPSNLFVSAMRKIRESYGSVRQRYWRGKPLTA